MFGLGTAKKLRFDGFLCPKKVVWSGVLKQEKNILLLLEVGSMWKRDGRSSCQEVSFGKL